MSVLRWGNYFSSGAKQSGDFFDERDCYFTPPIDIIQTKWEFMITIELPGLDSGNLDVRYEDDTVFIQGIKFNSTRHSIVKTECRYGRFERWIRFPFDLTDVPLRAKYEKGILAITVPNVDNVKRGSIQTGTNRLQRYRFTA